jgi:hypothetical protein
MTEEPHIVRHLYGIDPAHLDQAPIVFYLWSDGVYTVIDERLTWESMGIKFND